ncbi:hypothetical protein M0805_002646 [Coniferiporia weirii]|nr:hypothetical protein M0805_002646 [Coniferiporia weirii]
MLQRTSVIRKESELAPTIFKRRPPRSPIRFWKLNFHTFVVPGYLDPWKPSKYDPECFMKWWKKERGDTNARETDGWVDIRFFAKKVFHLVMYHGTETLQRSIFFEHTKIMAEKAKQIARVIALLYGSSEEYDSQIQNIFECCPPVIYLLQQAFKGCIDAVTSRDENEEIANGLSDMDLMTIDPLLTEIANCLFSLQSRIPLTIGRDYIKPDLRENIYEPSGSKKSTVLDRVPRSFHFSSRAQAIMVEEKLADDLKELEAVANGLRMVKNTRCVGSLSPARSPSSTDDFDGNVLDFTHLRNMRIKEMNVQLTSAAYWGEGSFSQVLKVKSAADGKEYAVKTLKLGHGAKKRFLEEVKIWAQLDDDFILRLIGFCVLDFSPLPGLITELCQESLKDLINSNRQSTGECSLGVVQRLKFLRDVSYGLRYLHLRSIAHGDLRAANVLITFPTEDNGGQPRAILCDFGVSRSEIEVVEDIAAHVIAGKRLSEAWRSPEIVTCYREKNRIPVSSEGDMYSYGCVFLEVVYDREPFKGVNNPGNELLKGKLPAICEDIPDLKATHWSFMKSLWDSEPRKRPNVNAVIMEINEFIIGSGDGL